VKILAHFFKNVSSRKSFGGGRLLRLRPRRFTGVTRLHHNSDDSKWLREPECECWDLRSQIDQLKSGWCRDYEKTIGTSDCAKTNAASLKNISGPFYYLMCVRGAPEFFNMFILILKPQNIELIWAEFIDGFSDHNYHWTPLICFGKRLETSITSDIRTPLGQAFWCPYKRGSL
jgi:hypothetical protein